MKLREGEEPVFLPLPSTYGLLKRERYEGKWIILFFYHKDFATGCDMDISVFIENMKKLKEAGVEIVGVSPDSLEEHFRFSVQRGIKFELVSDQKGKMAALYGALKMKNPINFKRKAFLISPEFKILKEYNGKKTVLYPLEILYDVDFLQDVLKNYEKNDIKLYKS